MMKRNGLFFVVVASLFIIALVLLLLSETAVTQPTHETNSLISTTPTPCPMATPEYLAVDPLISPTTLLSQEVAVYIGNGEAVTVTTQSGIFAVTGEFGAFNNPVPITVSLLPQTTHDLLFEAKVRQNWNNGCPYGGYTLTTDRDRAGQPLIIKQAGANTRQNLPLVVNQ